MKKFFLAPAIIFCIILIILISVIIIVVSSKNPHLFKSFYPFLLGINVFGLICIFGISAVELFQIFRTYQSAGTRFLMRLLRSIVFLIVLPVTLLYFFSLFALQNSINNLFNIEVEQMMEDAISLSDKTLDTFYLEAIEKTEQIFSDIAKYQSKENFSTVLDTVRKRYNAYELAIFAANNFVTFFSSSELDKISPISLDESINAQLNSGDYYISIDQYNGSPYIRVVKAFYQSPLSMLDGFILQAFYTVPNQIQVLRQRIEITKSKYSEQVYLKGPLRSLFVFNVFLIFLIASLFAIWAAIRVAKHISKPISELAKATNRVSKGDYQTHIEYHYYDEFGQLAHSFNYMIDRISDAQKKVINSHHKEEAQRIYLDNLLSQLTTGVMVFNKKGKLLSSNSVAQDVLGAQKHTNNISIDAWIKKLGFTCLTFIKEHLSQSSWQQSLFTETTGGFKYLIFRGKDFPDEEKIHHIVVFEDVTDLIYAQKQAAWVEVAKRLAHEIKNPLTPIQLAAQRIQRKYAAHFEKEEVKVFNKSIETIIEQVQSMKNMVQEFSEYARQAPVHFEHLCLNDIVRNVFLLYQGSKRKIILNLAEDLPYIYLSAEHIRRLCINLIQNAIEATQDGQKIEITTAVEVRGEVQYVCLCVCDQGNGILAKQMDKLFEPYFTSKTKGTGLGLAIVKKIVEEHGATIKITSKNAKGCTVMIDFPLEIK